MYGGGSILSSSGTPDFKEGICLMDRDNHNKWASGEGNNYSLALFILCERIDLRRFSEAALSLQIKRRFLSLEPGAGPLQQRPGVSGAVARIH